MAMILDNTTLDLSLDIRPDTAMEMLAMKPAQALCKRKVDTRSGQTGQTGQEGQIAKPIQTRVTTTRFGILDIDPELVLNFAEGLIGFEQCKRYIVVRHGNKSAFRWLQSLEESHVAFPVVEPVEFCSNYAPTISDSDARFLGLTAAVPTLLFTIVTVPPGQPQEMTANLLAPLVINGLVRRGKQVIVQNEGYTTRHKIIEELMRRQQLEAQFTAGIAASPVSTKLV